jgi:hypothetical protein
MPGTAHPPLIAYIHAIRTTARYTQFPADPDAALPKETQFAYHLLATTADANLFHHWADQILTGPPYSPLRPAIADNPLATADQLHALLAAAAPHQVALIVKIAAHPHAYPSDINGLLWSPTMLIDPSTLHSQAHPSTDTGVRAVIASRTDITPRQVRALLATGHPTVTRALAGNPNVAEPARILAGLKN